MDASPRHGTILESTTASVVARMLSEELSRRLSGDPSIRSRYLAGDEQVELEAMGAACARADVSLEDYLTTLEADEMLRQLHHAAMTEAMVGTADPGPNDQISRESPTGEETNRHFNDWMARKNSP
ncbi:MAG TPA: hypothetical protein VK550_33880 [Polyangiaceae bacterium]|jgi:hypothetical protein|nr:hypothetical protein [Polyangiaceae bacterium]